MTRKWKISYLAPLPLFAIIFIAGIWGCEHESNRIRSGEITERFGHDLIVGALGMVLLAIIATIIWLASVGTIHWIITKRNRKKPNKVQNRTVDPAGSTSG